MQTEDSIFSQSLVMCSFVISYSTSFLIYIWWISDYNVVQNLLWLYAYFFIWLFTNFPLYFLLADTRPVNYLDYHILCFIEGYSSNFFFFHKVRFFHDWCLRLFRQLYVFFHHIHYFQFNSDTGNNLWNCYIINSNLGIFLV